jgi:hypothetical protein
MSRKLVRMRAHALSNTAQALWSLAAVCKSNMPLRRAAANSILTAARKSASVDDSSRRVFDQHTTLVDLLIKLCHWAPPQRQASELGRECEWGTEH